MILPQSYLPNLYNFSIDQTEITALGTNPTIQQLTSANVKFTFTPITTSTSSTSIPSLSSNKIPTAPPKTAKNYSIFTSCLSSSGSSAGLTLLIAASDSPIISTKYLCFMQTLGAVGAFSKTPYVPTAIIICVNFTDGSSTMHTVPGSGITFQSGGGLPDLQSQLGQLQSLAQKHSGKLTGVVSGGRRKQKFTRRNRR